MSCTIVTSSLLLQRRRANRITRRVDRDRLALGIVTPHSGGLDTRPAYEITLMHVVEAIEGPGTFDQCVMGMGRCNTQIPCPLHDSYKPIRQCLKDYFNNTTLADLVASLRSRRAVLAATPSPATLAP